MPFERNAIFRITKEKTNCRVPFSYRSASRLGLRRMPQATFGSKTAMRMDSRIAAHGTQTGMDPT